MHTKQATLDELDSEVSKQLTAIAEAFRARFSVEISVKFGEARLSFGKFDGVWQFVLVDKAGGMAPVLSAPRHIRSEVLSGGVFDLLASADAQLDHYIKERQDALLRGRRLLAELACKVEP